MSAAQPLRAPFPYFGGKRDVATLIWARLGRVRQYIEPFCGSAAILLTAPEPASLEVVNDMNGFIANFWRAVKNQPDEVARQADYPVSHIDLGGRHVWLMGQRERLGAELADPLWPGDARVAGWWLWGQCSWIGSGWCEWFKADSTSQYWDQTPHASDAGMGVQALGQVPRLAEVGGILSAARSTDERHDLLTSCGRTAWRWLHELADRLERVRVVHGSWERCLNNHYGAESTAVFLDPPYRAFEKLYGVSAPCADGVEAWARDNAHLRVALCGHLGDYPTLDGQGWDMVPWTRKRLTYSGSGTTDKEAIWFSPACLSLVTPRQQVLFA